MRKLLVLPVIAFGVALAVVVENRLSSEAMAVVVGAICGISASIPISIALIIASSQNWGRAQPPQGGTPQPPQVHVIVVQPPAQTLGPAQFAAGQTRLLPPGASDPNAPRNFKMIGEEQDG